MGNGHGEEMGDEAEPRGAGRKPWGAILLGAFLALIGLLLAAGGAWLIRLGGSPYYLIAGAGCLLSGWFYLSGRAERGLWTYLLVLAGTWGWAVWEAGTDLWPLLPRVAGPSAIGLVAVLHCWSARARSRAVAMGSAALLIVGAAGGFVAFTRLPEPSGGTASAAPLPAGLTDDWTAFGRTAGGTRYSPAAQITPANVGALEPAWIYRSGDLPSAYPGNTSVHTYEATPLKVGDLVYTCTSHNIVVALDADTGKVRWRHDPGVDTSGTAMLVCRGVSYFEAPAGTRDCPRRIIMGTLDARIIALDAMTGRVCESFGEKGTVSLLEGLSAAPKGYYASTSPPAIVNGVAVFGGFVFDGLETHEPGGVIRGYDALDGKMLWSWDPGARDENALLKDGGHFTPGSPNSWTVSSADPELGLVYVPMGNATPDYVGMHRTAEDDRYSSAVVALDARTGQRRWHFQTVHHDLWDYDIGSQPVLFDYPVGGGRTVPALAQPTKQGDIFILDRRTGKPLAPVEERPVAKGDIPGERYSPTQPRSTGFPGLTPPPLRESDMWGATPLDQLWCRIRFRKADNAGLFTPPSTRGALQFPALLGATDWGSVAIDEKRGLMIANSSYMPQITRLIPRAEADRIPPGGGGHGYVSPQKGTPYAVLPEMFLSPLGVPCSTPPWGELIGIDIARRAIAWKRPLGTTRDHAPLGVAVPGVFNIGGSVATAGGVIFIAATLDNYLRAFDTRTGKELWRARLPAGGQASPMTYVSSRTGRQYVLISAGGHQMMQTRIGDYLIAYALPELAPR